jgi:hypothetical protein
MLKTALKHRVKFPLKKISIYRVLQELLPQHENISKMKVSLLHQQQHFQKTEVIMDGARKTQ